MTSGTCGQPSTTSSASANLQSSLENKLRAKTQTLGSTLYTLTWKPWVTPSGRSRSRLRASARRTSATDFTGWPTPTTRDWKDGQECKNVPMNALLGRVSWLAGWPTPNASNVKNAYQDAEKVIARKEAGRQSNLQDFAALAGWPTPQCMDTLPPRDPHTFDEWNNSRDGRKGRVNASNLRQHVVQSLGDWSGHAPIRLTATGEMLTGSCAGM